MNDSYKNITSDICLYRSLATEIWNKAYAPKIACQTLNLECQEGFLESCAHIFGAIVLGISDHNSVHLRLPSKTGYPATIPANGVYVVPKARSKVYYQTDFNGIIDFEVDGSLLPYVDFFDYDEFSQRNFEFVTVKVHERLGFINFEDIDRFVLELHEA